MPTATVKAARQHGPQSSSCGGSHRRTISRHPPAWPHRRRRLGVRHPQPAVHGHEPTLVHSHQDEDEGNFSTCGSTGRPLSNCVTFNASLTAPDMQRRIIGEHHRRVRGKSRRNKMRYFHPVPRFSPRRSIRKVVVSVRRFDGHHCTPTLLATVQSHCQQEHVKRKKNI